MLQHKMEMCSRNLTVHRMYAAHTAAVNFIPENFIFDIWQKLFLLHSSFFFNNIFGIFKKIIESVIKLPCFLINQSVILQNPLN